MTQSVFNQHSCVTILITIIAMAFSMVTSSTSYSPYKQDVNTGDNLETMRPGNNYNNDNNNNLNTATTINELIQYLKDVNSVKRYQCCPELYYYLTGTGLSRLSTPRSSLFLPLGLSPSLSSSSTSSSPVDKRMGSEFLGKRMGSEFLGKRVGSEFLGKRVGSEFLGKRMGSEFLVETFNSLDSPSSSPTIDHLPFQPLTTLLVLPPSLPKRYSEFLGGPGKRVSEFLGGPGKRNPTYGYTAGDSGKRLRANTGYYLAKKLSEILSRNSNGPVVGPYRPGGSEFLGGPGKR